MIRRCLILFFFQSTILTNGFEKSLHPFYFGWVDVVKKDNLLNIRAKFFVNDLEACLRKKKPSIDLLNDDSLENSKILDEYFKANFNIIPVNGSIPILKFYGYYLSEDMCHFIYSTEIPTRVNSVSIRCTMLFDGIPSQVNIIRLTVNKNTQTFFLKASEPQKQVNLF
jgi:hypothetical protein